MNYLKRTLFLLLIIAHVFLFAMLIFGPAFASYEELKQIPVLVYVLSYGYALFFVANQEQLITKLEEFEKELDKN